MPRQPKTCILLTALTLLLVVSISGFAWWAQAFQRQEQRIHTRWEGGTLLVSAYLGCPYIVTHLDGVNERGEECVARLPEPLVFIDSETLTVPSSNYSRLAWVDSHGLRVSPPTPGSPVTVLYYRAEQGK